MRKEPKADPSPKPDVIRGLRDLAANFVRAIDRTALEFESGSTSDLTDRVACLVALHDLEQTEAEKSKLPTDTLRSRLNLIRQVARAEHELPYSERDYSNGELKKRIEYFRQLAAVVAEPETISELPDEALEAINALTGKAIKARERAARQAERNARVTRFPRPVDDEDDPAIDEAAA